MCLNCPIPWEAASLGDDWSPTWVEGLVDKLPPCRGAAGDPLKYFSPYRRVELAMSVVGVTMYIYTP